MSTVTVVNSLSGTFPYNLPSSLLSELLALVQGIAAPSSSKLLPDLLPHEKGTFTLVLDLNETLLYSDWKVSFSASYVQC